METGEEYTAEIGMPLYRICSMSGDELSCISTGFSMYVFRPGEEFEILPVEDTLEIIENREYVRYYPYGETKTLAQLNETKFCRITWEPQGCAVRSAKPQGTSLASHRALACR